MSTYKTITVKAVIQNEPIRVGANFQSNTIKEKAVGTQVGQMAATDYIPLKNKPSIEEVVLEGNKTFAELGLRRMTNFEIEQILQG